jgi:hypothetical protein
MFPDNHQDIPRLFFSEYSEQPFEQCVDCNRELTEDVIYVIQKHFVANEAVFEMALCMDCNQNLNDRLSDESKQAIQQFLEARSAEIQESQLSSESDLTADEEVGSDDDWLFDFTPVGAAEDYLKECAYCGKGRGDCNRHAISGVFQGGSVIVHDAAQFNLHWPMLICEKCVEATSDLISQKTRDEWDRFVEHHFDGPRGLEVDWPTQQPVFM